MNFLLNGTVLRIWNAHAHRTDFFLATRCAAKTIDKVCFFILFARWLSCFVSRVLAKRVDVYTKRNKPSVSFYGVVKSALIKQKPDTYYSALKNINHLLQSA